MEGHRVNNYKDADALLQIIDERFTQLLAKSGVVRREKALVQAVNENKLEVTLLRDTAVEPVHMTVKNKTGEVCDVGDIVYVESTNGVLIHATLKS